MGDPLGVIMIEMHCMLNWVIPLCCNYNLAEILLSTVEGLNTLANRENISNSLNLDEIRTRYMTMP